MEQLRAMLPSLVLVRETIDQLLCPLKSLDAEVDLVFQLLLL
jgi:hypothetical protein